MRISGWHVEGLGLLRDAEAGPLPEGLVIVHGPNEAGKSTLLDFLRFTLFGYPHRKAERRPPLRGGRHGGRLHLATPQGPLTVTRYAGERGVEVRREDGTDEGEAGLAAALGGVDATLYRNVFAFSLTELQDLATLQADAVRDRIFTAGVVGAGQSAREAIAALDRERATLLRPTAASEITRLRKALREVEERLAAAREEAGRYAGLAERERTVGASIERLAARASALREQERRAARLLALWEDLAVARRAEAEAAALEPVGGAAGDAAGDAAGGAAGGVGPAAAVVAGPGGADGAAAAVVAAPGALARFEQTCAEATAARAAAEQAEQRLAALAARRDRLTVDATLLELADEVRALQDERSGHRAEETRAGALRATVRGHGAAVAEGLAALGAGWSLERLASLDLSVAARDGLRTRGTRVAAAREAEQQAVRAAALLEQQAATAPSAGAAGATGAGRAGAAAGAAGATGAAAAADRADRGGRRGRPGAPGADPDEGWTAGPRELTGIAAAFLLVLGAALTGQPAPVVGGLGAVLLLAAVAVLLHGRTPTAEETVDPAAGPVAGPAADVERWRGRAAEERASEETAWAAWLREQGLDPTLSPDGVRELYDLAARVREREAERARGTAELDAVDARLTGYRARITECLASAGMAGDDPLARIAVLAERVADQVEAHRRREQLDMDEAELVPEAERLAERAAVADAVVALLLAEAGVEDETGFRAAVDRAARHAALQTTATEARERVRVRLGGGADAEADAEELESGAVHDWERCRDEAVGEIESLERERDALVREHQDLVRGREELGRSADVAAFATAREALRAELEDTVRRWQRLTIARGLIEATRQRYERERQPAVLARASMHLDAATGGHHAKVLATDEGLSALDRSGARIPVEALSRGTAELLYLCLRVGLATEYAERAVALPLVLDDVLVNFDPERAEGVARMIATVANDHQVLVFTCHPGTVALLSAHAPDATILELPRHGTAAAPALTRAVGA